MEVKTFKGQVLYTGNTQDFESGQKRAELISKIREYSSKKQSHITDTIWYVDLK